MKLSREVINEINEIRIKLLIKLEKNKQRIFLSNDQVKEIEKDIMCLDEIIDSFVEE